MATFSTRIPIRFHHADLAGISFFGNVYGLAHDAFEDFVAHLGYKWEDWFKNNEWGTPVRHSACDYFAPLFPGHTYDVHITVDKLSESTMILKYLFTSEKGKHCEVTLAHIFVSVQTFKKISIPSEVRKRLEAYCPQSSAT